MLRHFLIDDYLTDVEVSKLKILMRQTKYKLIEPNSEHTSGKNFRFVLRVWLKFTLNNKFTVCSCIILIIIHACQSCCIDPNW